MTNNDILKKIQELVKWENSLEEVKDFLKEEDITESEIENYYETFKQAEGYPYVIKENEEGYTCEPRENASEGRNSLMNGLKKKLEAKKIYSEEEIEELEKGSKKIFDNLSMDAQKYGTKKGLIMGYVQSGKTTSMEGLIATAIDNGVNLVIVLSGIIENLRVQTLNRLSGDFYFRAIKKVNFENRLSQEVLSKKIGTNQAIVTVCLKNSTRISKLRQIVCDKQISSKLNVLIIDDEADQASLNTCLTEDERTKINEEITYIANNTEFNSVNYVAYTATPYGNFLNEYGEESLYPKDFIMMLSKSTKYIGASEIFGYKGNETLDIVRLIDNQELEQLRKLEKFKVSDIPPSMKRAIEWFICTVANFRFYKKVAPVSMLIHTQGMVKTHEAVAEGILEWFREIDKEKLLSNCKNVYLKETQIFLKRDFESAMPLYGLEVKDYAPYGEIEPYIKEIIEEISPIKITKKKELEYHKGINLVIDNSRANNFDLVEDEDHIRLKYPQKDDNIDYATAFLIIGGNTLSRGLTIEGLTVTYFARNSKMVDTLMQMARWFGYRVGYELLQRLWISQEDYFKFVEITKLEEELRDDLLKYAKEGKITPKEYGPRILKSSNYNMAITSPSKSQAMKIDAMNFNGWNVQTTCFENDKEILENNIEATRELISKIPIPEQSRTVTSNLVSKNVDFEIIKKFLNKFITNENNKQFSQLDLLYDWIEKNESKEYRKWNVVFAGINKETSSSWVVAGKTINKVTRSKFKKFKSIINIGVLTSQDDRISDMYPEELKGLSLSKKIEKRQNVLIPQLVIYNIDKNSKVREGTKTREDLNAVEDIIGINICIPGNMLSNNDVYVTIDIPNSEI